MAETEKNLHINPVNAALILPVSSDLGIVYVVNLSRFADN
jgi:hypothetical protein